VSSLAGRSKPKKLAYNYYEKWLIYILANHLSGRKKNSHRQRVGGGAPSLKKVGGGGADKMVAAQRDRRRALVHNKRPFL